MRALTICILLVASFAPGAARSATVCRNGSVTPAVVRKAAASLPMSALIPKNVGSRLPPSVRTAPLPTVLGQILPQYPGYRAVRTHKSVAIVDPHSRRIAYLLPLDLAQPLDCPDS